MPYQSLTRDVLRLRLREKWEKVPFWTDDEANFALNEALRMFNLWTGFWKRRIAFSAPKPYAHWISLPSSIVYGMRVEWGGFPLSPSSISDLNNLRPHWRGETTLMGGDIPSRPSCWAPAGVTLLAIWPADAVGCAEYVIDGVADTPVLSSDLDFLDLGEEELHALLGEALHICAFKESGPRFFATRAHHREFLQACARKNSRLKASAFYRRAMGLDRNRGAKPLESPALPLPIEGGGGNGAGS